MACRVDVLAEFSLLLVVLYDKVSFEDLTNIRTRQAESADFDASFNQLVILPPRTEMVVTPAEFRKHARKPTMYSPGTRRALCAPENLTTFGFSRMFQLLKGTDAGEIRVFNDLDEASRFVGVERREILESLPDIQALL